MRNNLITAGIATSILLLSTTLNANEATNQNSIQASDFIDLFEKMGGQHLGYRKAHANGLCASGTFTPSPNKNFKGAELLSKGELPVSIRFSLGGANPNSNEKSPGARGMGFQIKLPNGSLHTFTGNNFPVFAGKNPEIFYGFLSTLLPDKNGQRDPSKTLRYIQEHPSVQANAMWNKSAKTASSYANTEFFGLHTFFYEKSNGQKTKFRWHIEPSLGVKTLDKAEVAQMPTRFLADTFAQQLKDETIRFTLMATIGKTEDSTVDPSQIWPSDRPQEKLGTITVNTSGGELCKNTNFDPNIISAGFTPSEDPILRMRSAAYAISFGKRLSGQ